MWRIQEVARQGEYLAITITGGLMADLFGTITSEDLKSRVREYARNWSLIELQWDRGVVLGYGGGMVFYGRAESEIPTAIVRAQVTAALDSFWVIGATDATVLVDDTLSFLAPKGSDEWATTLQLAAVAVIVVGVVWGIKQFREIAA